MDVLRDTAVRLVTISSSLGAVSGAALENWLQRLSVAWCHLVFAVTAPIEDLQRAHAARHRQNQ